MAYNPREIVTDGPFSAPRVWQHVLKALIALSLYTGLRDGLHFAPWLAAVIASPVFMALKGVKEWNWPSDPNEHSYSHWLRFSDFMTDLACSSPAVILALCAGNQWVYALVVVIVFSVIYFFFRHNARP